MMVVVCYDVSTETKAGRKRLKKIAEKCHDYGQRVQYSVFECIVDPSQWLHLKSSLTSIANSEEDTLRFYFLGKNWRRRVEHWGKIRSFDQEGPLIF